MRIGIVDLDTSHPAAWIPIERDFGHEIVGIFDGGAVHPPGYAQKFAAEHKIANVFGSIEQMVERIDCAIVHSCDWDTHVAKARPFVEAGKAVLIDKPTGGNIRDLQQIKSWLKSGVRIAGGSSLRFCAEAQQWLAKPQSERGTPQTVLCGCGVDEFNYGIHAYSMLAGIIGGGARVVRHMGVAGQRRVQIRYADGPCGIVVIGQAASWLPFYTNIVTDKSLAQFIVDNAKLYRALLEATLPFLSGQTDNPLDVDAWLEPEMCALAARKSWLNGDREIALTDLTDGDAYDGKAFAESYRETRYPNGW